MPSLDFPRPAPTDPGTVVSALEKAAAQRASGALREAVRWVHRAADAAEAAGDDARALELARRAADLMSSLELPSVPVPFPRDEAAALAPFDDFNEQTIVDSPAALVARHTAQGTVKLEELETNRASSSGKRASSRPALRVAVPLAAPRGGLLSVRILADGAEAPKGTTEALLVLLDPDAKLPLPSDLT